MRAVNHEKFNSGNKRGTAMYLEVPKENNQIGGTKYKK
jgi:hypothetical protein